MANGEVSVELTLLLEKARQQIKSFAPSMGIELAKATSNVASGTDKAANAQDRLERSTKKATSALQKQLAEWRKSLPAPIITDVSQSKAASTKFAKFYPGQMIRDSGGRLATSGPGLNAAIPPVIPSAQSAGNAGLAGLLGGKSINSTLLRSIIGSVAGSALAGPIGAGLGASAMGASGPLAIGIAAVTLALKGMRMAVQLTAEAFDRARKMYASVLQGGGMAQRFVITQNVLAQVIGVSERDVYQYGRAIGFVNEQLQVAIRTLDETQRTLAATSMKHKVMAETFHAVWAKVAEALAEPMNRIYALITALEKLYIVSGAASMIGAVIGGIVDLFTRIVAFTEIIPAAFLTMATAVVESIKWMMAEIHNIIANSWVGKRVGMKAEVVPNFQNTKDAATAFKEVLKTLLSVPGAYAAQAPSAPVSINRLPGSAWEKMGMVIGRTGGSNPQERTANNTAKLVNLTEKMLQKLGSKSGHTIDNINPTASYA